MDQISQKNESFINDELQLLKSIDDMNVLRESIKSTIKKFNQGVKINKNELTSYLADLKYLSNKISDVTSSVRMYCGRVFYDLPDLTKYSNATRKNIYPYNCSLKTDIEISAALPDFTVDVANLGFDGIKPNDIFIVKMENNAVDEKIHFEVPSDLTISKLQDVATVSVSGMKCPDIPYEYNLYFGLKDGNTGAIISETLLTKINITEMEAKKNAI